MVRILPIHGLALAAGLTLAACSSSGLAPEPEPSPDPRAAAEVPEGGGWLVQNQAADGSFAGADGEPEVGATALVALALLGDGHTLDTGPYQATLRRSVDWLLAQQQGDGGFGDSGPGSTQRLAQAAYALSETAGLSGERGEVRAAARRAVAALSARQLSDGGWSDGTVGAASDGLSTAWAAMAHAAAQDFDIAADASVAEIVTWFDEHPSEGVDVLGAELFVRFVAGQDPSEVAVMAASADRLLAETDAADPESCYWATYSLYQTGGQHWRTWQNGLREAVVDSRVASGDEKGSWEPTEDVGRATTTALRVLTLEAYFRYARLIR